MITAALMAVASIGIAAFYFFVQKKESNFTPASTGEGVLSTVQDQIHTDTSESECDDNTEALPIAVFPITVEGSVNADETNETRNKKIPCLIL